MVMRGQSCKRQRSSAKVCRRLRWRRYGNREFTSYTQPAWSGFVEEADWAEEHSAQAKRDMRAHLEKTFTGAFLQEPLADIAH